MKTKTNKNIYVLILTGFVLILYFIWLSNRTVEIVDIHQRNNYSDVLVTNFPFTDKGKINWWMENKDRLKTMYNIPKAAPYGLFTIVFWDFGEGYKEEGKYDRRCFDDMKTKFNCIDKNRIFSVENNKKNDTFFTVHDGIYRMNENGNIKKTYSK
ncbi:Enterobacterial putative membrane protein (DUF943) [Serratia quinivorans]|uniref:DUF943 family protein n=1 Tax=Serratia quinivorans TaxID=137545 RepID=UPI002178D788|nr:DUF943 family protein [Serratia quinivorans]CAI1515432.1 Enterobacterial putative membrane protein (DUF943) [Serratia quinivorans]